MYNTTQMTSPYMAIYWLTILVLCVLIIAGRWKIFEKMGVEGWKSLIPFYNSYILYEETFGNGWWFLLSLVPIIGNILCLVMMYKLCKLFGHGIGYTIGLFFLPFIFYPVLGFGGSEYQVGL